jgi:hypothetical protein
VTQGIFLGSWCRLMLPLTSIMGGPQAAAQLPCGDLPPYSHHSCHNHYISIDCLDIINLKYYNYIKNKSISDSACFLSVV